jgi:hypothetical protein
MEWDRTESEANAGPQGLAQRPAVTHNGVNHAGGGDEHQQGTEGHSDCCGLVLGLQASRACSRAQGVRQRAMPGTWLLTLREHATTLAVANQAADAVWRQQRPPDRLKQ